MNDIFNRLFRINGEIINRFVQINNPKGDIRMKIFTQRAIREFKQHLLDEEKSPATITKYLRDIATFAVWLGRRNADKAAVLEYKELLISRFAPSSVNSILSSLNSFFDYHELYGLKVKHLKLQRQIFATKNAELTRAEYKRLLAAAQDSGNRRLNLLMQTICATGIRVSELQYITIDAIKAGKATIRLKGKMRVVIIPHELCKMLKKYAAEQKITDGSIFVSRSGKPLDRSNIWKLMKALCDLAGVARDKVFPHNLRHLFARTYYSIQKDIVRLADILGHSSVNTTRIYTMESGEIHRRQIQGLGLLKYS